MDESNIMSFNPELLIPYKSNNFNIFSLLFKIFILGIKIKFSKLFS